MSKFLSLCFLSGIVCTASLHIPLRNRGRSHKTFQRLLKQEVQPWVRGPNANPIDYLRNIQDVEYVADITIGTPAQVFTMVLDTGSSNLWASSSQCKDTGCSNMHKFQESKSSTYVGSSQPFSLQYGTGSCSGTFANDTVGTSVGGVVVKDQPFGVATTVADFFKSAGIDGIWGLGLKALANGHVTPPLDNMAAQGLIPKRVLGVYLNSQPSGSSISFGSYDSSTKCKTPLKWFKYQSYMFTLAYYLVRFSSMSVGGQTINLGCSGLTGCQGLLDTGTSLIAGPEKQIAEIVNALNISSDCSNFDNGPPLTINVGGNLEQATFTIPSNVYTLKQGTQCAPGLQGMQGAPFFILGDTFLRNVYAVFDNDNMKAGLCQQA